MKDALGGRTTLAADITMQRGRENRSALSFEFSRRTLELRFLTALAFLLLAAASSRADKVVLSGGDVIEGTVTRQSRFVVVIEHEDLGRMEIPRGRIESVTIDTPDVEIVLLEGDTIQGRLVREEESKIVLNHRDLGRMEISRERIRSLRIEVSDAKVVLADGDTIEGKLIERSDYAITLENPSLGRVEIPRERIDSLEIKEPEFKKEIKEGWFGREMRWLSARASRHKEKGWRTSLDLSLDSSTGNTDEQAIRVGGHVRRSLPDLRLAMDLSYYRKVSDDELTDNKFTFGVTRDWLYPESVWFCFVMGRFDYDEFESWEQRANLQAGPGYRLVKTEDVTLDARLGIGARREWGSQENDVETEGLIGADLEWDITDKQRCKFAPYYFPVVGDSDNYRGRVSGEWRFLFDKDMHLSFLIGTLYEYTSLVDPGSAHGDLRVYLGLQYSF
ncbi:MAG: DUF481 domain-containing protein [Planctomycetota bacterium]|jgi:putative salt-induced outer membrane protein YdiY